MVEMFVLCRGLIEEGVMMCGGSEDAGDVARR